MKWFLLAFKKFSQFSGRSRRKEYWMFVLITFIFQIITFGIDFSLGYRTESGPITGVFILITLIPNLSLGIRRMHDVGNNGSVFIILYISSMLITFLSYIDYEIGELVIGLLIIFIISGVISLVYLVRDSNPEENQYGPNPKLDDLDINYYINEDHGIDTK